MMRPNQIWAVSIAMFLLVGICALPLWAQQNNETAVPLLTRAVMCETIESLEPHHIAVTFSIDAGQISCFTAFASISQETYTMHRWYRRDTLVTAKRLTLKPPSWSTYSSIQLRQADKGPWRVEIRNADDTLLKTLRFSVTD